MPTDKARDRVELQGAMSRARWIWLVPSLAVLVLLGWLLALRNASGSGSFDALRPVSKPQPVTQRGPLALPPDAAPMEVADSYLARWDAGDVVGYEALVAPTANLFTQDAAPEVAIESWYRIATGVTLDRSCELVRSDRVRCETTFVSGLRPGEVVADREVMVLVIAEGQIVEFVFPHGFRPIYDDDVEGLTAYRDWMRVTAPEEFNNLFLFPETILVNTEEARQLHRDLIAEFHRTLRS